MFAEAPCQVRLLASRSIGSRYASRWSLSTIIKQFLNSMVMFRGCYHGGFRQFRCHRVQPSAECREISRWWGVAASSTVLHHPDLRNDYETTNSLIERDVSNVFFLQLDYALARHVALIPVVHCDNVKAMGMQGKRVLQTHQKHSIYCYTKRLSFDSGSIRDMIY